MNRLIVPAAALLAIVAVGLAAWLWLPGNEPESGGEALVGGPFELVDQDGETRRDSDFRGDYMLVFFGYNYCPDICPTALYNVTLALDEMGAEAADVQPIYITIDPERDRVAEMKRFAANFHPRLVALTGTPEKVADAARAYRVYYKKNGEGEDYLVDHSGFIYLMDRDGRYVRHFSHDAGPSEIAEGLRKAL